jgi:hypothetical protein
MTGKLRFLPSKLDVKVQVRPPIDITAQGSKSDSFELGRKLLDTAHAISRLSYTRAERTQAALPDGSMPIFSGARQNWLDTPAKFGILPPLRNQTY